MLRRTDIPDRKLRDFADVFLDQYLQAGFGVFPKRQLDLLVFYGLQHIGAFAKMSNYDIATALGTSETRVRNLRMDAALRFTTVNRAEKLREVVARLFEYGTTRAITNEGTVTFELDDPVLQREFEQAARDLGYFTDTSFRRSIIQVSLHVFVAVVATVYEDAHEQVAQLLKTEAEKAGLSSKELARHKGIGAQVKWLMEQHEGKVAVAGKVLSLIKSVVAL